MKVLTRSGRVAAASAAFVILLIFALSAIWIRGAFETNIAQQQALRKAQVYRARVLRLQVDEEAGLRGYLVTGSPLMLEPYEKAVAQFEPAARILESTLHHLSLDDSAVHEEEKLNQQWLARVAGPSLKSPYNARQLQIQLLGKSLVDRFRNLDQTLLGVLSDRAITLEQSSSAFVSRVLWSGVGIGLASALILLLIASIQSRLARALELQRGAYEAEKRVADALQEAFLRTELPQLAAADLHAVYVAAGLEAKIGGDWYDAFELPNHRILFSIGDVAGHGIEAAVVMNRVRQAIVTAGIVERDPGKILERANDVLLLQGLTIVTAICGFIDLTEGTITYANAGHPPLLTIRGNGEIEALAGSGPPLGALDHPQYQSKDSAVLPGSMLVLYTDGLVEYDRDWESGERKLRDALRGIDLEHSADPAAQILEAIFTGHVPNDDVAILTIRFRIDAAGWSAVQADFTSAATHPGSAGPTAPSLTTAGPLVYARTVLAKLETSSLLGTERLD